MYIRDTGDPAAFFLHIYIYIRQCIYIQVRLFCIKIGLPPPTVDRVCTFSEAIITPCPRLTQNKHKNKNIFMYYSCIIYICIYGADMYYIKIRSLKYHASQNGAATRGPATGKAGWYRTYVRPQINCGDFDRVKKKKCTTSTIKIVPGSEIKRPPLLRYFGVQ